MTREPLRYSSVPDIRHECDAMYGIIKYRERQTLHRESTSEAFAMSVRLFAMGHHRMGDMSP
jgi:hypothetical protein